MNYVLDASVALKWVLPEPLADKARQLRDDYRNGVHRLLAPDIFPAEVANSLTRAERRKIIIVGQALPFWTDIMATAPALLLSVPVTPRAIAISSQTRHSIYDCLYVALAEREACQLVTDDASLLNNLQPHFPFIIPLASLP